MQELEKYECVSSVITIAPVLNIELQKMGPLGILMIIDDGVYVCICTVYLKVLTITHNTHLSMTVIFQQK